MISDTLARYYYPDDRKNGTRLFYSWVGEELHAHTRALNVGAGPAKKSAAHNMKPRVQTLVGIDIDPVVLDNEELHEAFLIENDRFPLADDSFDCAYADMVLEHVDHPGAFLGEIHRVLKRGASFFFRTPNLGHYVTTGSRLTPFWIHRHLANRMRGLPSDTHEPWPTRYRLNSRSTVARLARDAGFSKSEFRMIEPDPSYLKFNGLAFRLGVAYERLVNSTEMLAPLRANILGKLTK